MKTTCERITFEKARSSFFLAATIEGRSRQTLNLYEYSLDSLARYMEPTSPLEATSADVRRYLLTLTDAGYAPATIATHVKELKVFFNFLASEGHLEKSPIDRIRGPKLPRSYPYVLSEEEADRLLKAARGRTPDAKRNLAMLLFFLDTGVRVSELCGLTLEDVSLATYQAKVDGKTGERTVHFGKETAKALSAHLKARGFIPHEDSFFVVGQNRLRRDTALKIVKRLGEKAGITGKRVSPHTLRHTSATFWIKNGGDTVSLRRQLGHVDHRMVDVYVNLVGRDLAEAHGKYSPLRRVLGRR